jgi:hypothetical protein
MNDAWQVLAGLVLILLFIGSIEGALRREKRKRNKPVLGGVLDHQPGCRASGYHECTCTREDRVERKRRKR